MIPCPQARIGGTMAIVKIVLAWTAFAVFHSLTVSEGYERAARRVLGERIFGAYHRLLFTTYNAAALLVLFRYLGTIRDAPFYQVVGWPRLLFHAVQAAGVVLVVRTPWDVLEFLGLRQVVAHWKGTGAGEAPRERLFTTKAYAVVRHPLTLAALGAVACGRREAPKPAEAPAGAGRPSASARLRARSRRTGRSGKGSVPPQARRPARRRAAESDCGRSPLCADRE